MTNGSKVEKTERYRFSKMPLGWRQQLTLGKKVGCVMMRPAKLLGLGLVLAIALAVLGLHQDSVPAQDKKLPEKQKFNATTADGVKLVGDFYPSPKGRNGPVIMLLHAIGRSDTKDTLSRKNFPLAFVEALQEKGYAVLTFDFRGYGESIQVEPKFWDTINLPVNRANPPATVEAKQFTQIQHFLSMGNDLIAAKDWLNLANNGGDCNSASTVIVACEETAILALAWAYAEYVDLQRRKDPNLPTSEPQGKDLVAFIFYSYRDTLNSLPLGTRLGLWFNKVPDLRDTPMANNVSVEDKRSQSAWSRTLTYIRPETLRKKYEERGTGTNVIKSKLVGHRLLTGVANYKAEEWIGSYLDRYLAGDRRWRQQPQVGSTTPFNTKLLGF